MKNTLKLSYLILLVIIGCSKSENENSQSPAGKLGEVGNAWQVKIDGVNNFAAEITEKDGNVYTLNVNYAKMISKTLKFGFDGNEVVDYVYSKGATDKPFKMVDFNGKVGDTYVTEIDGIYHERQIVERTPYYIPCLDRELETIGVYEYIPEEIPSNYFGYTIREIIWYWHPQFGLVCMDVYTDDGMYINIEFINIDL